MRRHLIFVLMLSALFAVVLVSCTAATSSPSAGPLRVVATTTQVGEAARFVGGDAIQLTVLLTPGAEAHDYEMTPQAAAAVEDATVILKSGAGLEAWLDDALATIGGEDRVRDMSTGIELREAPGEPREIDPHYWLTAPNAIQLVENVRDALST